MLQTATRAARDAADDDMVVGALLHDFGDLFAPHNHSEFAAALVRPYVREEVYWVVRLHGIFQLYYRGENPHKDPNRRDRYRASPYYEACIEFCERWDQTSFDPAYRSFPLAHFAPIVRRVFARPPHRVDLRGPWRTKYRVNDRSRHLAPTPWRKWRIDPLARRPEKDRAA
jgi:predicted HD phosphohydrolase